MENMLRRQDAKLYAPPPSPSCAEGSPGEMVFALFEPFSLRRNPSPSCLFTSWLKPHPFIQDPQKYHLFLKQSPCDCCSQSLRCGCAWAPAEFLLFSSLANWVPASLESLRSVRTGSISFPEVHSMGCAQCGLERTEALIPSASCGGLRQP